jgi:putative zinc finger/helix-turn-helix YgiT family protein
MKEDALIGTVRMECPICDKIHDVEKRKRIAGTVIKDEEVTYEETYFYCVNADEGENEFETGEVMDANLMNARNAYRVKTGLLTSDEIVKIRESYGLSQVDLARILGWGEATVSRYESKAIQDKAYDTMLRLIRDNPLKTLDLLKKNGSQMPEEKISAIHTKIVDKLDKYGKEYLSRQKLESEYAEFDEPTDYNGFKLLDIDKIETVISYFAEGVSNLYKTKLMKMLWYADVLSYIRNNVSMTGLVYRHENMGALPVGHYSLMNLENLDVNEESSYNYESILHIYPCEKADYSLLSGEERAILDRVIEKFRNWNTQDIVNYMHNETAYRETVTDEIISFKFAKEINPL